MRMRSTNTVTGVIIAVLFFLPILMGCQSVVLGNPSLTPTETHDSSVGSQTPASENPTLPTIQSPTPKQTVLTAASVRIIGTDLNPTPWNPPGYQFIKGLNGLPADDYVLYRNEGMNSAFSIKDKVGYQLQKMPNIFRYSDPITDHFVMWAINTPDGNSYGFTDLNSGESKLLMTDKETLPFQVDPLLDGTYFVLTPISESKSDSLFLFSLAEMKKWEITGAKALKRNLCSLEDGYCILYSYIDRVPCYDYYLFNIVGSQSLTYLGNVCSGERTNQSSLKYPWFHNYSPDGKYTFVSYYDTPEGLDHLVYAFIPSACILEKTRKLDDCIGKATAEFTLDSPYQYRDRCENQIFWAGDSQGILSQYYNREETVSCPISGVTYLRLDGTKSNVKPWQGEIDLWMPNSEWGVWSDYDSNTWGLYSPNNGGESVLLGDWLGFPIGSFIKQ